MTLHEKALNGTLKEVDFSSISTEMLNEKDEHGSSVWHLAAQKFDSLDAIPKHLFTWDALNQRDEYKRTLLHIAAECNNLNCIPKHFFTHESLTKKDCYNQNVFHLAAKCDTLKDIPRHLFTIDVLNEINKDNRTVWHLAAQHVTIKDIPIKLFSEEALMQEDYYNDTVWHRVATNSLNAFPSYLITEDLLRLRDKDDKLQFLADDIGYINKIISQRTNDLNLFIENNPHLAKDIEFRDSRYKVIDVKDNTVCFGFNGIKDKVILSNKNVAMNNNTFDTLHSAVSFIEKNYLNIEKSLLLPVSTALAVGEFAL